MLSGLVIFPSLAKASAVTTLPKRFSGSIFRDASPAIAEDLKSFFRLYSEVRLAWNSKRIRRNIVTFDDCQRFVDILFGQGLSANQR